MLNLRDFGDGTIKTGPTFKKNSDGTHTATVTVEYVLPNGKLEAMISEQKAKKAEFEAYQAKINETSTDITTLSNALNS